MTTGAPDAIAALDRVAQETFAYFAGPGRSTSARVDRWQARDVLMHFIYFHDATAWGIQSAAQGGPPWPVPADGVDELLAQLRQAHARLIQAARRAPSLDAPCFKRATGETMTGRQRLELLAKHWTEHVDELKKAAAPAPAATRPAPS